MHDSFIIHHGLEQELKDSMNKAFKDICKADINVDLKYNSITERQKQSGNTEPVVCDKDLSELLKEQEKYSIYNRLHTQFEEYKLKQKK